MNFIAIKKHDSTIKYTLLFFLYSIDLFHKTHKQFISLLSAPAFFRFPHFFYSQFFNFSFSIPSKIHFFEFKL